MNRLRLTPPGYGLRVDLIYINAGGGHQASAVALKTVAEASPRPWRVRLVNVRDILEPLDLLRRMTGIEVESVYNRLLKSGLTIGSAAMVRMTHMLIRQMNRSMSARVAAFYGDSAPDLVVSLIPHFNRALYDGLRASDLVRMRSLTPMATIMTDLADYPPNFWIDSDLGHNHFLVCGSAKAVDQAKAAGYTSDRVMLTSGMIVRAEFYRPIRSCRGGERRRLGLEPDLPTGLVMFGGFGSRRMLTIARQVANTGLRTQLIFMCGRNDELRRRLAAMRLPFPHHIEGFTRDIPYFMRISDYFAGKPGPGCISEALVSGLPVIVERNAWTMVQERYNTEWIEQEGLGLVLRSFSDIAAGIATMLDPARMARFRQRVGALNNRAVFEIPMMLEELIAARPDSPKDASDPLGRPLFAPQMS